MCGFAAPCRSSCAACLGAWRSAGPKNSAVAASEVRRAVLRNRPLALSHGSACVRTRAGSRRSPTGPSQCSVCARATPRAMGCQGVANVDKCETPYCDPSMHARHRCTESTSSMHIINTQSRMRLAQAMHPNHASTHARRGAPNFLTRPGGFREGRNVRAHVRSSWFQARFQRGR